MYSFRDLGFDKKSVFRDDFLLNSTDEKYMDDEYGMFDIRQSEEYNEDNEKEAQEPVDAGKPVDTEESDSPYRTIGHIIVCRQTIKGSRNLC
jgi:hypothetical protein